MQRDDHGPQNMTIESHGSNQEVAGHTQQNEQNPAVDQTAAQEADHRKLETAHILTSILCVPRVDNSQQSASQQQVQEREENNNSSAADTLISLASQPQGNPNSAHPSVNSNLNATPSSVSSSYFGAPCTHASTNVTQVSSVVNTAPTVTPGFPLINYYQF